MYLVERDAAQRAEPITQRPCHPKIYTVFQNQSEAVRATLTNYACCRRCVQLSSGLRLLEVIQCTNAARSIDVGITISSMRSSSSSVGTSSGHKRAFRLCFSRQTLTTQEKASDLGTWRCRLSTIYTQVAHKAVGGVTPGKRLPKTFKIEFFCLSMICRGCLQHNYQTQLFCHRDQ